MLAILRHITSGFLLWTGRSICVTPARAVAGQDVTTIEGLGTPARPDPVQAAFIAVVAEYRKRFGKVPSYYSETCYTSGRWINEAAKQVGGKVEERAAFMAGFRKVEIPDAPRGPLKLDAHGNPIQNIYVRRVERKGGELQNTVIHTFPAVSQFWTYKPEDFLKNPVYSRDYPPCTKC